MNQPKNSELLIQELEPAVGALSQMPVEMWHLWILWVVNLLSKYATEEDYQEFLARLILALQGKRNESW